MVKERRMAWTQLGATLSIEMPPSPSAIPFRHLLRAEIFFSVNMFVRPGIFILKVDVPGSPPPATLERQQRGRGGARRWRGSEGDALEKEVHI